MYKIKKHKNIERTIYKEQNMKSKNIIHFCSLTFLCIFFRKRTKNAGKRLQCAMRYAKFLNIVVKTQFNPDTYT